MYILFLNILACQVSIFPIYFILHIYPIISFSLIKTYRLLDTVEKENTDCTNSQRLQ